MAQMPRTAVSIEHRERNSSAHTSFYLALGFIPPHLLIERIEKVAGR